MQRPGKIPVVIGNNAEELQRQLRELQLWRDEVVEKERNRPINEEPYHQEAPPIRSKTTPKEKPKEKESRIKSTDYESWEKYDDSKYGESLDMEDKGPTSQDAEKSEKDKKEMLRHEALYEKERGNEFVKQKQWNEAIACYTRAIELKDDDAIFYANRGLCFLKKENFHAAEADCSKSLSLDPTYIKALQRRSCAREFLGYLRSAASDLAEIMKLEPNNESIKKHHADLVERMGTKGPNSKSSSPASSKSSSPATTPLMSKSSSKFFDSSTAPMPRSEKTQRTTEEILADLKYTNIYDQKNYRDIYVRDDPPADPDAPRVPPTHASAAQSSSGRPYVEPQSNYQNNRRQNRKKNKNTEHSEHIQPVIKPPHLRSQKPLYRVNVNEIPKGFSATPCSLKDTANGVTKLIAKHINRRPKFGQNPVPIPYDEYLRRLRFTEEKENAEANPGSSQKGNKGAGNKKPEPKKSEKPKVAEEPQATKEKYENLILDIPKTTIQFITQWRLLQGSDEYRSKYLKNIAPKNIPVIFKNSMESEILTDILNVIKNGDDFAKSGNEVKSYPYMKHLTEVKRFSALSMFLSNEDKQVVKDILARCQDRKECTEEEVKILLGKYEIN